jgi:hypothetical protein
MTRHENHTASFPRSVCEMEEIVLHDFENTWLMAMTPSISSITFYAGVPPISYLQQRLIDIITINPWLSGTLKKISSISPQILQYDPKPSNIIHSHLQIINNSKFCQNFCYENLIKNTLPYLIPEGSQCLNSSKKLLLMTIVIIDCERYAIIFSLSHVIADGHTFYSIYKMLSPEQIIVSLEPKRDLNYSKKLEHITGGNKIYPWFLSLPVTLNIFSTLLFSPKPTVSLNVLNPKWIESQKLSSLHNLESSSSVQSPPFISTNDIFTHWFFRICRPDVGIMAMNFRNRISSITDSNAGNYEALMGYLPSDYHTPIDIRLSLSPPYGGSMVGAAAPVELGPHGYLPGYIASLCSRFSLISSWVSFYHEINLTSFNSHHLLHLPCIEPKNVAFNDIGVLFCPKKNEIAFLGFTRSYSVLNNEVIPRVASSINAPEDRPHQPLFLREIFDEPTRRQLDDNSFSNGDPAFSLVRKNRYHDVLMSLFVLTVGLFAGNFALSTNVREMMRGH